MNLPHHGPMRLLRLSASACRRLAALGLLAILALLVQPICSAYELAASQSDHAAAQGAEDGTLCCSGIEVDALMAPPPAPAVKAILAGEGPSPLTYSYPAATLLAFRPPEPWSTPPPLSLSYHVRSARILR